MAQPLDHPSDAAVDAWIALMRAQQAAWLKIERAFRQARFPPYAWYDALWTLERAGEAGLRPAEIENRILVAQSNISRLLTRLESEGLVRRKPHASDGRGQIVLITDAGQALRKSMWPTYAKAIQAAVGASLNEEEAQALAVLLRKLSPPVTPPQP